MMTRIKQWVTERGIRQLLPSPLRGGLKFLSGYLVAIGFAEGAALETASPQIVDFTVALLIFIVAQLWSWSDTPKKND